jgi:hypothetical protein
MKASMRIVIAVMIAWTANGIAQHAVQTAMIDTLQVKEVNVTEIDASHVKLGVDLNLTAKQTVTLENMRLCSLHLNGLPVFAAPLNQEIVFKKGVATALPPIYVTILFRDLHTTEPLRRMIENQSVKVEGELTADLKLNMVEKLALHTMHPDVAVSLAQDVPAETGGTPLERSVALSILTAIDNGLQNSTVAGKLLNGLKPAWIRDLETSTPANLYVVETSYTLAEGDASYPVISDQLGFRVKAAQAVTTAEAEAPWKYDAEFLGAVQSGTAKLVKNSPEIVLKPLAQGDPLRLSAKDFVVELRGVSESDKLISTGSDHSKIKVLRRDAPTSLAVLTLEVPPAIPALTAAPAATATLESWELVAVFRLRQDPVTKKPFVEALQMAASRDGQSIRLSQPVDEATFGSPIVTPDGVIGIVQDEQTGAFLPADLLAPVAAPVQTAAQ